VAKLRLILLNGVAIIEGWPLPILDRQVHRHRYRQ
jgi:hypothetical protein